MKKVSKAYSPRNSINCFQVYDPISGLIYGTQTGPIKAITPFKK